VPGSRVAAVTGNRILYRDGLAAAALVAGEIQWLQQLTPRDMREAESALVKRQAGSPLLAYLR
jgi:ATP-dependent Lhr-like helicase